MKTKMLVDRMALKKAVDLVEDGKPLVNRSELYEAIAGTEWARNHKPKRITPSVAMLRIEEYGLSCLTPKGKRGRQKGVQLSDEHKAAMRLGRRRKKNIDVSEISVPETRVGLVDKIASGSLTAAIKLKCLDCTCFDTNEIKYCTVRGCALWNFRPYMPK